MLLLVTDTSGKHGSVALARASEGTNEVDVVEEVPLAGGTFSAQLVPQIAALLARHNFSKKGIGAFIVISGPGSFTGLRVGLAAIKALAEILEKPIVPVSLLEVLALESGKNGSVLAAIDAGRSELYVGEYVVANGVARRVRESLLSKNEFSAGESASRNFASNQSEIVVTPDERLAALHRSDGRLTFVVSAPSAKSIACLGWQKLRNDETVSPAELEANYIRRSDAEIFAKPS